MALQILWMKEARLCATVELDSTEMGELNGSIISIEDVCQVLKRKKVEKIPKVDGYRPRVFEERWNKLDRADRKVI